MAQFSHTEGEVAAKGLILGLTGKLHSCSLKRFDIHIVFVSVKVVRGLNRVLGGTLLGDY